MEILKQILFGSIYVLLLVIVLAVIYAVIWYALFIPVAKNRRHKEKVKEANLEYNKIAVEHSNKAKALMETDKDIKHNLYKLHGLEEKIKTYQKQIEELESELNTKTTNKNTSKKK